MSATHRCPHSSVGRRRDCDKCLAFCSGEACASGLALAPERCYVVFALSEDNCCRLRPVLLVPRYAHIEHISRRPKMPILEALGPSPHRAPPPVPASGRSAAARRLGVLPMPSLEWNDQVARETAHLYERIKAVVPAVEWPFFAPYVRAINALKRERNAVILAHNYQTPEIYNCVADVVGDSLQLAREATKAGADVIVQCAVHFMAETAKILNPDKVVLIPDLKAGCSLAEAITAADVRLLRARFPGVPVVTYVNTSAEGKAERDICCPSPNALAVVESLGGARGI